MQLQLAFTINDPKQRKLSIDFHHTLLATSCQSDLSGGKNYVALSCSISDGKFAIIQNHQSKPFYLCDLLSGIADRRPYFLPDMFSHTKPKRPYRECVPIKLLAVPGFSPTPLWTISLPTMFEWFRRNISTGHPKRLDIERCYFFRLIAHCSEKQLEATG